MAPRVASASENTATAQRDAFALRIASAVVMAIIALAGAYIGGWTFKFLMAVIAILAAYEWDRLCGGPAFGPFGTLAAAACAAAVVMTGTGRVGAAFVLVLVAAVLTAILARGRGRDARWLVGGLLYVGIPAIAGVWIRDSEWGRLAILGLFAVVWSTDTGAYFAGKTFGGPKLAPAISPGKTWSGLVGGVVAATVAALVVGHFAPPVPLWSVGAVGALLSLVGQVGDLGKSKVKRHFQVKDSGNLIPGHGGVIDRLDSTMATLPVLAIFLALWL